MHIAKVALVNHLKVLHVTLEMSEARVAQRYLQTFFAMSKRKETVRRIKFEFDKLGRLSGFVDTEVLPSLSMDDPNIRRKLERRVEKWKHRLLDNIIIKQFPTGRLTTKKLEAYMDNLEATEHFTPDLLVIDYPDLMQLDSSNYRFSLDELFKDIRGIAVERNIAVAAVSQGNRASNKAKQVGSDNVAEAWSKIFHADCVITYTQTPAEKQIGLARLLVAAGRNDADGFEVVISQNYAMGQYVIASAMMTNKTNYWNRVEAETGEVAPR
jgi:hypothetical protein